MIIHLYCQQSSLLPAIISAASSSSHLCITTTASSSNYRSLLLVITATASSFSSIITAVSSNSSLITAASSSNMTHSLLLAAVVLAPISSTAGFQPQTSEAYSLEFSAKHYAVSGQGSLQRTFILCCLTSCFMYYTVSYRSLIPHRSPSVQSCVTLLITACCYESRLMLIHVFHLTSLATMSQR